LPYKTWVSKLTGLEKNFNFTSGTYQRDKNTKKPGFTGADLANLLNESAILAARRDKTEINKEEVFESIEKVLLGPERKSHILSKEEKKITAYHEAGHALVAHLLEHTDPIRKISIVSRGRAAGYTLKLPEKERYMKEKAGFVDELAVFMAGYEAEQEVFGDITTGASNDLKEATNLSKRLITQHGMSDSLAPRTYGEREEMIFLGREIHEQRDYSEKVAEMIDKEISKFIKDGQATARNIIVKNRKKLDEIAEFLLKYETMNREEFEGMFEKKPSSQKATTEKLEDKKNKNDGSKNTT